MTTDLEQLQKRAQLALERLEAARRDPRFLRVIGGLVGLGVLETNYAVPVHQGPLDLAEALWAGEYEPRVLELLPALLVRMPAAFTRTGEPPPVDLDAVVQALQRGAVPPDFRGTPGAKLRAWL